MKRSTIQCHYNGIGIVAKDYNHFIANLANGIIRGADQWFGPVGSLPGDQLLGSAHAAPTAGSKKDADATYR
jgi:hypothetical protein